MKKANLTSEQIYKRNQKRSKALRILAPICFWGFLALSLLCFVLAVKNSLGNVAGIMRLLDTKKYTGEELRENYGLLVDKYGEWVIGNGSKGFEITFINIGRAVFSGFMIANAVCSVVFFLSAYILGKWTLPKISAQILLDNQDMVNLTILRDSEENKRRTNKWQNRNT